MSIFTVYKLTKSPSAISNQKLKLSIKEMVVKCKNNPRWDECYGKEAIMFLKKNPDKIPETLHELQLLDPKTTDCHYLGHKIADNYVDINPSDPYQIFNYVSTDECAGGFIHGLIEGHRRYQSDYELTPQRIIEICDKVNIYKTSSYTHEFCSHTIGHILLLEQNADVDKSLDICETLPADAQYQCLTGVYMESMTQESLSAHGILKRIPWTPTIVKNQITTCNSYQKTRQVACWEELAHMISSLNKLNPGKTYADCAKASSTESLQSCTIHASQLLMISPYYPDDSLHSLCRTLENNKEIYERCLRETIDIALLVSKTNIRRIQIFCDTLNSINALMCHQK